LLWTEPDWLESVHDWIRSQLERLGLERAGEIEQPHVRPWSTVLRVPTGDGDVWFKANMPTQAFEVAVVETLAARRPDLVPTLLGTDLERGWMLQGDGGTRLREILEETGDFDVWIEILPLYAELQMDVAADRDRLLAAGVPDRLLESLPGQFEGVLTDAEALESLTRDERCRLAALAPRIEAECRELAAYGLPETIQHDDLHDGQVFVRDGRFLFFDWGDSCVSHPFYTLVVTLAVLAYRLELDHDAPELDRFRDAYLEPWTCFRPRSELEQAYPLAYRLGVLCRGLTWRSVVAVLPQPLGDDEADAVPERMRMLLDVYEVA
jgi:phosphotransferase family enzyme